MVSLIQEKTSYGRGWVVGGWQNRGCFHGNYSGGRVSTCDVFLLMSTMWLTMNWKVMGVFRDVECGRGHVGVVKGSEWVKLICSDTQW